MKKLAILILCIVAVSCGSINSGSIKFSKNDTEKITMIGINEKIPVNSLIISRKSISTSYINSISYDSLILIIKNYALKNGGNTIKILSNKPRSTLFNKTLYKVKFLVLKTEGEMFLNNKIDSSNVSSINIYRFSGASLYKFNLHICDSTFQIKSKFKKIVNFEESKRCIIWAEKGSNKTEKIELKLEKGKKYYIKCYTESKLLRVIPKIEIVDSIVGKKEFNFFND